MSNNIAKGRVEFLQNGIVDAVNKCKEFGIEDKIVYAIFQEVLEDDMIEEMIDSVLEGYKKDWKGV